VPIDLAKFGAHRVYFCIGRCGTWAVGGKFKIKEEQSQNIQKLKTPDLAEAFAT
jgi:hypothetical protein